MRVSCKCALYSPDGSKVLLADYGAVGYGLPGGHIDAGETPDQAMNRELKEELGIHVDTLQHRDFWMHHNGRLILGYTGTLSEDIVITHQAEEMRAAVWVAVDEIRNGVIDARSYGDFICQFQPNLK